MTRRILLALAPAIALALPPAAAQAAETVAVTTTAAPVTAAPAIDANRPLDLARYTGRWFEIARLPHFFQRNCARNVTAAYAREEDFVRVVNRCEKENGEAMKVEGKAFVVDAPTNRKLEVGFFEIFGWMPFTGDYWVLDFDPEYRWAIVGGEDKDLGWILARKPVLDTVTRADIDARLRALGYDPAKFINTEHKGAN